MRVKFPNSFLRIIAIFSSIYFIVGPYGIRLLNETLMWHIGSQVQELKKLVLQNKDVLVALRTNFDKPETMKELAKKLVNVDSVLQVRRENDEVQNYIFLQLFFFQMAQRHFHSVNLCSL